MSGFVGYWGGAAAESELLLSRVIAAAYRAGGELQRLRVPPSEVNPTSNPPAASDPGTMTDEDAGGHCPAGVAGWGGGVKLRRSPDATTLAAFSAAGLAADVSVEATGKSLTLRRDQFGRGTLFWTRLNNSVWFASRLRLLLPLLTAAEVSAPALYGYACFSYVPSPLTPVKGVFALHAGSELKWRAGEAGGVQAAVERRSDGWQAGPGEAGDEGGAVAQLRERLQAAMTAQVADLSSETVGVFLSGGLDSAVTAALLARAGVRFRAYTLDLGDEAYPEWPFAERVAAWLNAPLVKVRVTPRRARRALEATAAALDLPFGDGVTVPLYLLGEAAARDVAVVFNGEGGDQLFAGWTNKPLIAAGVYGAGRPAGGGFCREYLRTFHRLHGHEAQVFSPSMLAEVAALNPLDWLGEALRERRGEELLHRLRRANLMLKGAQNIQPRATNLAHAHRLLVRSPFCDAALARWTFGVAGRLWLRGMHEKYLLKQAVADWLPPEVVWREKRGMGVPLTAWCLKSLRGEVAARLRPAALRGDGRWQPDIAARIAAGELSGQVQGRRIGECLWLLLMWQAWRKTVLRGEVRRPLSDLLNLSQRWPAWGLARG